MLIAGFRPLTTPGHVLPVSQAGTCVGSKNAWYVTVVETQKSLFFVCGNYHVVFTSRTRRTTKRPDTRPRSGNKLKLVHHAGPGEEIQNLGDKFCGNYCSALRENANQASVELATAAVGVILIYPPCDVINYVSPPQIENPADAD